MEPVRERVRSSTVQNDTNLCQITLDREDFSVLYPGMIRYVLTATDSKQRQAVFRTNTFEYSPLNPLAAETSALQKMDTWEQELAEDPTGIFRNYPDREARLPHAPAADLVVIQGSPRADGNCGILTGWASDAAAAGGHRVAVIYPHDLDIHCCIGCYQCYNTGTCVFEDDMRSVIDAVRDAHLVIVCSPVYTNTVPAGLKLVIDRMQAFHAERTLYGGKTGQNGLLFSVAGRKGGDNFTCITKVVNAFFRNIGIEPAGQVLIDSVDAVRDIRVLPGRNDEVTRLVRRFL
jgi:multimeric flavodoxin WrbA